MTKTKRIMNKKIILCCGQNGRAVVIGDITCNPVKGKSVKLTNARMVLYWAQECGGLLGLGAKGPKGKTRITHAVPELVETVWQEWVAVTPEAAKEIDKWPAC